MLWKGQVGRRPLIRFAVLSTFPHRGKAYAGGFASLLLLAKYFTLAYSYVVFPRKQGKTKAFPRWGKVAAAKRLTDEGARTRLP